MTDFHKICPTGNTMDSIQPEQKRRCAKCNGDGEIPKEGGTVLFDNEVEKGICPDCKGAGKI